MRTITEAVALFFRPIRAAFRFLRGVFQVVILACGAFAFLVSVWVAFGFRMRPVTDLVALLFEASGGESMVLDAIRKKNEEKATALRAKLGTRRKGAAVIFPDHGGEA